MRHTCLARRGALLRLTQCHRLPASAQYTAATATTASTAKSDVHESTAQACQAEQTSTTLSSSTPPPLPASYRTGHEMTELLDGLLTSANARVMAHTANEGEHEGGGAVSARALFVRLFEAAMHRTTPGTRSPAYIAEQCLLIVRHCSYPKSTLRSSGEEGEREEVTQDELSATLPFAVQMQCLRPSPQLLLAQRLTPLQELPDSLQALCEYSLRPRRSSYNDVQGADTEEEDDEAVRAFAQRLVSELSATAGLVGSAAVALRSRLVQQQQQERLRSHTGSHFHRKNNNTNNNNNNNSSSADGMTAEALRRGNVCTLQAAMDCVTLQLYLIHALLTRCDGSLAVRNSCVARTRRVAWAMLRALETQRFVLHERSRPAEGQRALWHTRSVHGLCSLLRHALERGAELSGSASFARECDARAATREEARRHRTFRELCRLRAAVQAALTFYFAVLPCVTCSAAATEAALTTASSASPSCVAMLIMLEQCWRRAAAALRAQPSAKEAVWWLQLVPILLETYNAITARMLHPTEEQQQEVEDVGQVKALDAMHAHVGQLLRAMLDVDAVGYARCRRQQLQLLRQSGAGGTHDEASASLGASEGGALQECNASEASHTNSSTDKEGSSADKDDEEKEKNASDAAPLPGLRRIRGKRSLFYQDVRGNRVLREEVQRPAPAAVPALASHHRSASEQGGRRSRFVLRGSRNATNNNNTSSHHVSTNNAHAPRGAGCAASANARTNIVSCDDVSCSALFAVFALRPETMQELREYCTLHAVLYDGAVEAVWLATVYTLRRSEQLLYPGTETAKGKRSAAEMGAMQRLCVARARLPLAVLEATLHVCHTLCAALRTAVAQSPHTTLTPRLRSRKFTAVLYQRAVLLTLAIGSQLLLSSHRAAARHATLLRTMTQLWHLRSNASFVVLRNDDGHPREKLQDARLALSRCTAVRRWGRVMATYAVYEELRSLHATQRSLPQVVQSAESMLRCLHEAAHGRCCMLAATRQAMAGLVLRYMKSMLANKYAEDTSARDGAMGSCVTVCAGMLDKLVAVLAADRALLLLCCYPSFLHGLHDIAARLTKKGSSHTHQEQHTSKAACEALYALVVAQLVPLVLSVVVAGMRPAMEEVTMGDAAGQNASSSSSSRHTSSRSRCSSSGNSNTMADEKIHVLARCVPALQLLASVTLLHEDARRASCQTAQGARTIHQGSRCDAVSAAMRSVDQSIVSFAWAGPLAHVVASCLSCLSFAGGWRTASQRSCLIPLPPLTMFATPNNKCDRMSMEQLAHAVSAGCVPLTDWLLLLDASTQLFSRQPHVPLMYTGYVDHLVGALGECGEAETNMAAASDAVTWSGASPSTATHSVSFTSQDRCSAAAEQSVVREVQRGSGAMQRWQAHLHDARARGLRALSAVATQAACLSTDWLQPLVMAMEHYLRTLRLQHHVARDTQGVLPQKMPKAKSDTGETRGDALTEGAQYCLSESVQEATIWLLLDLCGSHLVGQRGSWALLRTVLNLCGSAMHAETERRRGAFSAVRPLAVSAVLAQLAALPSPSEVNIIGGASLLALPPSSSSSSSSPSSPSTSALRGVLVHGVLLPPSFVSCLVELGDAVARLPTTIWGVASRQTRGKGLLADCTREEMRALLYGVRQAVLYLQAAERALRPGADAKDEEPEEGNDNGAALVTVSSVQRSFTPAPSAVQPSLLSRPFAPACAFQAVAAGLQGSALAQHIHLVFCTVLCASFVLEITAASALHDSRIEDELCAVLTAALETLCQMLTRYMAYTSEPQADTQGNTTTRQLPQPPSTDAEQSEEQQRDVLLWAGLCVCTNMTAVMLLDRGGRVFTASLQRSFAALLQRTELLVQCDAHDKNKNKKKKEESMGLCGRLQRGLQLLGSVAVFSTQALDRLAIVYPDRADLTAMLTSLRLLAGATVREPNATQSLLCKVWQRVQEELRHAQGSSSSTSNRRSKEYVGVVTVPSLSELRATLESFNTLSATAQANEVNVSTTAAASSSLTTSAGEEPAPAWGCDVPALMAHVRQQKEQSRTSGHAMQRHKSKAEHVSDARDVGDALLDEVNDEGDEDDAANAAAIMTAAVAGADGTGHMLRVDEAIAEELLSMSEIVDVVIAQAAVVLRAPTTVLPLLVPTAQQTHSTSAGAKAARYEWHVAPPVRVFFDNVVTLLQSCRLADIAARPMAELVFKVLFTRFSQLTREPNGDAADASSVSTGDDGAVRPPRIAGLTATHEEQLGLSALRVRQMWQLLADKWHTELIDPQAGSFAGYQAELLRALHALRVRQARAENAPQSSSSSSSSSSDTAAHTGTTRASSSKKGVEDIFVMHPLGSVAGAGQRTAHMRDEVTATQGNAPRPGNHNSNNNNNRKYANVSQGNDVAGNWSAVMAQERDIRPVTESLDIAAHSTSMEKAKAAAGDGSAAFGHYRDVYHPPQLAPALPLPLLLSLLKLLMQSWRLSESVRGFAEAVCVYAARQYVLLRPCLADSAVNVVPLLAAHLGGSEQDRAAFWEGCFLPTDDAVRQGSAVRAVASRWLRPEPQSALHEALQVVRSATCPAASKREGKDVNRSGSMSNEELVMDYVRYSAAYLKLLARLLAVMNHHGLLNALSSQSGAADAVAGGAMQDDTLPYVFSTAHLVAFTAAEMNTNVYEETLVHVCDVSYHITRHVDSLTHAALDADAQRSIITTTTTNSDTPCTRFVDELRAMVVSTLQEVLQNCAKEGYSKGNKYNKNIVASAVVGRRPLASRILLLLLRNSSGGLALHLPSSRPPPARTTTSDASVSVSASDAGQSAGQNEEEDDNVHRRLRGLRAARPELFVSSPVMLALMTPSYLQQVTALYLQGVGSSVSTCVVFCLDFYMQHGTEATLSALLGATTALLGVTHVRSTAQRLYCEQLAKTLLSRPHYRQALQAASIAAIEHDRATAVVENEILIPFLAALARFDAQVSKRALAQLLHTVMHMRKDLFGHPPTADRQDKLSLVQASSQAAVAAAAAGGGGNTAEQAIVVPAAPPTPTNNVDNSSNISDASSAAVPDALASFSVERNDTATASHRKALAALHLTLPTVVEVAMHLQRMRAPDKTEAARARGMLKAADDARRERMSVYESLRQQAADVYAQPAAPATSESTSTAVSKHAAAANVVAAGAGGANTAALADTAVDAGLHLEDPWDYGVALLHLNFALHKIVHAAVRHLAPHLDMRDVADVMEMLHIIEHLPPASERTRATTRPQARRPSGMMTGTLRVLLARALMGAHSLGFTSLGRPQYMPLPPLHTGDGAAEEGDDGVLQKMPLLLPTGRNESALSAEQTEEEEVSRKDGGAVVVDAAAERRMQLEAQAAMAVAHSLMSLSRTQRDRVGWAMWCIRRCQTAMRRKETAVQQRRRRWRQHTASQEEHTI